MGKPTRVDQLTVHHDDDATTEHGASDGAVGFYAHKHGLDVVAADGSYVARYTPNEFLRYSATGPAPAKA